jgi:hypothetical protein
MITFFFPPPHGPMEYVWAWEPSPFLYDLDAPTGMFCEPPSPPTSPLSSTGSGWPPAALWCDEDLRDDAEDDMGRHLLVDEPTYLVSPLVPTLERRAPPPLSAFDDMVARYNKAWDDRRVGNKHRSRHARLTRFEETMHGIAKDIYALLLRGGAGAGHNSLGFLRLLHACHCHLKD